jgi:hypothetical protein
LSAPALTRPPRFHCVSRLAHLGQGVYVSGKVGKGGEYEEIARGIDREECEHALALARELGLRLDPHSVGERHRLVAAR